MKNYIKHDEWRVIEEGFDPNHNRITESLCSIGNGKMGQRANFEEHYSGDTLRGSYIAGVYYPDKTRVGWWKNGYPEYFAKILNAPNWIGIDIHIDGIQLDLAKCNVESFSRVLDMRNGLLTREFIAENQEGKKVQVKASRFISLDETDAGAIKYSLTALNFSGTINFEPYIDADVFNEDSNYEEKFWNEIEREIGSESGFIVTETKKTGFKVGTGMRWSLLKNGKTQAIDSKEISREKYVANHFAIPVSENDEVCMYKYAVNVASLYYADNDLLSEAKSTLCRISEIGFEEMLHAHTQMWAKTWETADVVIEGDIAAQQGIRFNIFQLYQTYTGEDERLNIGPKGFTGEKYGGVTYWDTEAYCLPFYLRTTDQKVARNLLVYRYRHLAKAIENAEKLGFKDGAALYPMVTINGEECHNEWEITFEEIHRNGAIAYAIYNYVNYTGDEQYLEEYGLEVLIALSRFWRQRVNWSEAKQKFVMLGVTGPNEYENNVNNNWYTNKMAQWTLKYTINQLEKLEKQNPVSYKNLAKKVNLNGYDDANEQEVWFSIIEGLHFPEDVEKGIFLQQDGFCDKVIKPIHEIPLNERPINQNWSWDRILRSCYIKQADVLQGLYFLEDQFSMETIRRNFDFYEPITVHESSLSPCIHTILASRLGYEEKAYELYLRTTRLDLDDYNNDTEDGCHITSMAGTWMSIVEGFAGLRVRNDQLYFRPFIPGKWKTFRFMINFRGIKLVVKIGREEMTIENLSDHQINLYVYDLPYTIAAKEVFHEKIIHQLQVY